MENIGTQSLVVNFVFDRETKGAIRFQEVDVNANDAPLDQASAVVGTLYCRKAALKGARPLRVRATLELIEE